MTVGFPGSSALLTYFDLKFFLSISCRFLGIIFSQIQVRCHCSSDDEDDRLR